MKNEWWIGPLAGIIITGSIFAAVILAVPVGVYYIAPFISSWYKYWGF